MVHPGSDLGGLTVADTRPTRFGVVTLSTQMIILEVLLALSMTSLFFQTFYILSSLFVSFCDKFRRESEDEALLC